MTLTAARQVADAVLYEGYLLYPYRASSSKNVIRWQFGVLGPVGAAEAGVGEAPNQSSELVLQPRPGATVTALLRFLQVQSRTVEARDGDCWVPVDELQVGTTRWIPFHEAVAREIPMPELPVDRPQRLDVGVPGGRDIEDLYDGDVLVGRLIRTRWALAGRVTVTRRPGTDPRLVVLGLHVENSTSWAAGTVPGWTDRDVAARYSFVGTHLLVTADRADFVSLLDGPDWADADTRACRQTRCWPVLIADDTGKDAVLIAPIILGDHPTIAPESAGDLFDATEIDEILTLRIMTMTESERAEARGTDPRAAAILARCDAMTDEELDRLHGARRDEDVDPEKDAVMVGGVPVAKGTRVLLRPSRRADAQDLFLAGLTAVVARVYTDLDGATHVAVMLEDDPGTDLYAATGRFYYFGPEELEPLPERAPSR